MNRSNSDCCASVGGGGAGAVAGADAAATGPSRGNNATVSAAPPMNRTDSRIATGLANNVRRSAMALLGNVVIGNGVFEPDRKNNATIEAAIARHRRQTAFSTTKETYSKYSTT